MNPAETKSISPAEIDASCRVPLLALFGGAALWLVLGLGLGIAAMLSFHAPNMFADCPFLTYGRAQAAANDLLLYGFVIPAALGVMLWIFARLSQAPLALPIVPVAAANLWHVGVLLGTGAILAGQSTGYPWLEYPRAAAVLLFAGFMLTAVSAVATMGFRRDREMHPAHWFLFASLLWFVWSYSTANLFLLSAHPPRGVVQAVVAWWFGNNLLFVWLALAGVGMAFYFLPKFAGKPLAGTGYALFAFLTLIGSGAWCGIPRSAPVPAWLPALGTYAAMLAIIPVLAIAIIAWRTISGSGFSVTGGPNCFVRFGTLSFVLSALLYLGAWCPRGSQILDLTWYGFGVSQWQLLGFAGMMLLGGIYHILPRVMAKDLPFPLLAKANAFIFGFGVLIYVLPLLACGLEQGLKLRDPAVPFADVSAASLLFLRISTTGQLLMLVGALCLLVNVLLMTLQWKIALAKAAVAAVLAPLETRSEAGTPKEVKS